MKFFQRFRKSGKDQAPESSHEVASTDVVSTEITATDVAVTPHDTAPVLPAEPVLTEEGVRDEPVVAEPEPVIEAAPVASPSEPALATLPQTPEPPLAEAPQKRGLFARFKDKGAEAPAPVEEQTAVAASGIEQPAERPKKRSLFARLKSGLSRTSSNFAEGLGNLFLGRKQIDDDLLEELETQLLVADVGIEATTEIIGRLTQRVSRKELADTDALYQALQAELKALLEPCEKLLETKAEGPFVILMVGVNGVGKTTTIGKLAKRYQAEGKKVMLAAGDTFRAAAVEQLQVWGERNRVPVVAQHTGADSASVLFDALQSAQAKGVDVLIADTAGRLQNKDHLMEELKKIVRVLKKLAPEAPHEVMLVLDAGTGQNALAQAKVFGEAVGVTGVTLTKLDGTAKGGIIFAICKQLALPVRFIGVGEQAEDLRPFVADDFIRALFAQDGVDDSV